MGDNNAVIVQIVAVVAVLFFFFITYMNTKTWRWPHVTFNFLVFAAALTYIVYASQVVKTRAAWQKEVGKLEKDVVKQQKELEVYLYGDRAPNKPERVPSAFEIQEATKRVIIDRGRVWRNCVMVESQVTSETAPVSEVKVKLSTVPAGALEGVKVEPNGLKEKDILYAFKDITNNGPMQRFLYVGEFRATAVSDDSVSLATTIPLDKIEQSFVAGAQPWILYEVMPRDSMQGLKAPDPNAKWEDIINKETFPSDEAFRAALEEYERDGGEAKDDDPQENVYAVVKFNEPYKFTVDAPDELSPAGEGSESGFFNNSGQALLPLLRRGSEVSFAKGDTAEIIYADVRDEQDNLKEKGAKELEKEGVVSIQKKIYRRKLIDYAYEFSHIWSRRIELQDRARELKYEMDQLDIEFATSEKNLELLNARINKLIADGKQVVAEKQKITAYTANVKAALDRAKGEFESLVKQIDKKHDEILVANQRLASRASTGALPASAVGP